MLTEQCLTEEGLSFSNVSFKGSPSISGIMSHLLELGHLPTLVIGKADEIIHYEWLRLIRNYPLSQVD